MWLEANVCFSDRPPKYFVARLHFEFLRVILYKRKHFSFQNVLQFKVRFFPLIFLIINYKGFFHFFIMFVSFIPLIIELTVSLYWLSCLWTFKIMLPFNILKHEYRYNVKAGKRVSVFWVDGWLHVCEISRFFCSYLQWATDDWLKIFKTVRVSSISGH